MAETVTHRELKALSADWLKRRGCDVIALEVKLPLSNFRADVASYRSRKRMSNSPGETFVVECKQSRADFMRDAGMEEEAKSESSDLRKRMKTLRTLLSLHLPQCRKYQSLFCEYDTYDFCDWRHEGWYRITRRLQVLENRLEQGVKFAKIARYGCANYCYIAISDSTVASESEVPMGWGLLRREGRALEVVKEALKLDSICSARLKLLERIAISKNAR